MIRYGLVGAGSNFAIYLVYLLVTYLGVEPKIAMTLVYIVGVFIGFIGHRQWTFSHSGDYTRAAVQYAIAHLLGYLINFLILFTFVDRLGYAHQGVQIMAIIVVAGFLFIVFKYHVFHEKNNMPEKI